VTWLSLGKSKGHSAATESNELPVGRLMAYGPKECRAYAYTCLSKTLEEQE